MIVNDLVRFNREKYYNGAVQTEWFYDNNKVEQIAESYVFHGPKYYGVSITDIKPNDHRLIDTASFTEIIAKKIFEPRVDNSFVLTIAGYGTGKSHLAVTLGALFAGDEGIRASVVNNITKVDKALAASIDEKTQKKNLVIALNGMRNFNLDSEVLHSVKYVLQQNGIGDEVLKSLTKTYDVAKYFVNENYDDCKRAFEEAADVENVAYRGNELKKYLLGSIESDNKAINIVNTVYKKIAGASLRWEQGVSAGEVILQVCKELCGQGKPFNKVVVLFDEFGRYIEYVAANPTVAGDASLQQVFEAIQSSEGRAVFVGFIQYELEAYLSHIDKSANIIRYVGRYSSSEKYYLSSNFETIIANLLEKTDTVNFDKNVCRALDHYENYHNKILASLERWTGSKLQKTVWASKSLYRKVIMEGCYPLHPITVWLLSNSSKWMQQRSTIAFCADMYEKISAEEISGSWLPYIYPVDIIDSGIFSEMLNAEEKGLVKSQNCMLYNEITVKIGEKLSEDELTVLKSVLISRIAGFRYYDKEEACIAFRYLSNLKEENIKVALRNLEDRHGVVSFDDQSKTYDLIAEANGFNEFIRVFARYRMDSPVTIESMDEDSLRDIGMLEPLETSFAQENHISSIEWKFEKRILDSRMINKSYLENTINALETVCDGESLRGIVFYLYLGNDTESETKRITELYKALELDNKPVVLLCLDDPDEEIIRALTVISTLNRFSAADNERFSKHLLTMKRTQKKKVIQTFNSLVMARNRFSSDGVITYEGRLNKLCAEKFFKVFFSPVPFVFDGFESNRPANARKTLTTLCAKMFDNTLMNIQSYQGLTIADKNRISTCLSVEGKYSWKVFQVGNNDCQLVTPQNELIRKIYDEIDSAILEDGIYTVNRLFGKYLRAPYGMNMYSFMLFVVYFIRKHGNRLVCALGDDKLTADVFNNKIVKDGKIKLSELLRVTIRKNLSADVDVIADLCAEILDNTDVYKCGILRRKLIDTAKTEAVTPTHKVLIGQAEMRLDDGERLRAKIEDDKQKISQYLNDARMKFSLHKFIGIFDFLNEVRGTIETGLPYMYSQEYIMFMEDAFSQVKFYLSGPLDTALKTLKCTDITQISSFRNTYSRVVKVLREKGYEIQANKTSERVQSIIEETEARNAYNQAIGECEKDVELYKNVTRLSFYECDSVIEKLEGWKSFFSKVPIPVSVVEPLMARIDEALIQVNKCKTAIVYKAIDCEKNVDNSSSIEELTKIRDDIEEILECRVPSDMEETLRNIIKKINETEEKIRVLPDTIEELRAYIIEEDIESSYDRALRQAISSKVNKLIAIEERWVNNVLVPLEGCNSLDAQMCAEGIEKLHTLPTFASQEVRERARNMENKLTDCLHECRVQGVVSLYNSLTKEEKDEFRRIISEVENDSIDVLV